MRAPAASPSSAPYTYGFFSEPLTREEVRQLRREAIAAQYAELGALEADWVVAYSADLPHADKIDWSLPMPISVAEDKFSTEWMQYTLPLGSFGLQFVPPYPEATSKTDAPCVAFCSLSGPERTYDRLTSACAFKLDDDGVMGWQVIHDAVEASGYLAWLYTTPSHGKSSDKVPAYGYESFVKRNRLNMPLTPRGCDLDIYLNRGLEFGPAYRNVRLVDDMVIHPDHCYRVTFDPQERVAVVLPYSRPIPHDLCQRLVDRADAVKTFGRLVELEVIGRNGGDWSTFKPSQPSHLPVVIVGAMPPPGFEQRHAVLGQRLLDPIPLVEKAIASLPVRTVHAVRNIVACEDEVPPNLQNTTRGVSLGEMIAYHYPDLVHRQRDRRGEVFTRDNPLMLDRCPFADEHGSRRGESDGSLYVIDPDPEAGYFYPTVKCRHSNTCGDRRSDDFIEALIEDESLTWASVYADPSFRDLYEVEDAQGPTSVNHEDESEHV